MFENITPRAAKRSRWGVRTSGCPPNPLNCGACSSLMMTRMFGGRVVMRASVFEVIRPGVLPACHVQCFHFPAGTAHQSPDMGADRQDRAVLACEWSQEFATYGVVRDLCNLIFVPWDWQVFQHPVPFCDEEEAFWIRNDLAPGAKRAEPQVPVSVTGALRRAFAGRPPVPVGVTGWAVLMENPLP